MNWQKLQADVGEWSAIKFRDQSPEQKILGMIKELGVLAHCRNIEWQEPMQEEWGAVGGFVIWILDYCHNLELDIENILDSVIPCDLNAPMNQQIFNIANALSLLSDNPARRRHLLGCVLNHLKNYCIAREINFESCIESTWDKVQNETSSN